MTETFLKYLDGLKDTINLFESLVLSTEIMGEIPLSEEQTEEVNTYLKFMQSKWEDTFLIMLEHGVKWIKYNKELQE